MAPAILWFRRDLRLDDLPALAAAAQEGSDGVVPLFVVDKTVLDRVGPNRRHFLAQALRALDRSLGGTLVLRTGDPRRTVPVLAAEVGASVVAVTTDFGPYGHDRDLDVARALSDSGRRLVATDSCYAVRPATVRPASGSPLQVFSAFRRHWEALGWDCPAPPPTVRFVSASSDASLDDIERTVATPGLHGLPRWWDGLPLGGTRHLPAAGSAEAKLRLDEFIAGQLQRYADDRDRPALDGTSGLSPYLHFGCIHPRTILSRLGTGRGADQCESSWHGATSTPTCSGTIQSRFIVLFRVSASTCAGIQDPQRRPNSEHGQQAPQATRWSMPACDSY